MARNIDAKCRQCRRADEKLFLKGQRCGTAKCAMVKRPYAPGQRHEDSHSRLSEYGFQLREKQKLKKIYGVLERQFRKYFDAASRKKGVTGEILLRNLELRLDNVVYRLGFASSRASARQLVRHGFVEVNGKKVNIPSFSAKKDNTIIFRKNKEKKKNVELVLKSLDKKTVPSWLSLDVKKAEGKILELPSKSQIDTSADVKAVVELYSK